MGRIKDSHDLEKKKKQSRRVALCGANLISYGGADPQPQLCMLAAFTPSADISCCFNKVFSVIEMAARSREEMAARSLLPRRSTIKLVKFSFVSEGARSCLHIAASRMSQ